MPYLIYMKTYSYLDKYLFTYFDKFIKNPSYRLFSEGSSTGCPIGGMERDYIIVIFLTML